MALDMEVGLRLSHIVLDGAPAPLPQKGGRPPIFGPFLLSPNGWMHQDATWCGGRPQPSDFVLDGDPASPPLKGHSPPIFVQCPLWPNDWMDEDATWYGGRPQPRPHCIRRGPSFARKGHSSLPSFRPMSIVASVAHLTVAHLLSSCLIYCSPVSGHSFPVN